MGDFDTLPARLGAGLGLPEDAGVRRFHESRRLVKAPSASQVRRPIHRNSVGAWEPYAHHLAALRQALEAAHER